MSFLLLIGELLPPVLLVFRFLLPLVTDYFGDFRVRKSWIILGHFGVIRYSV